MPYTYAVRHDLKLIHKRVWGEYSDAESQAADREWRKIQQNPEILAFDELQDLTEVTHYGVSLETLRGFAAFYNEFREERGAKPKRLAYVVPSKVAFGSGRMYQSLIEMSGVNFQVFEDLNLAVAWLGLDHLPELPKSR